MQTQPMPPPARRTLVHPGAPDALRIRSRQGAQAGHLRLLLQPGLSLFDAVVLPLLGAGVRDAAITLLAGQFEQLVYCVAADDPAGISVAAYGPPNVAGSGCLLFGHATLGTGLDGMPALHCHAGLCTADGAVRGGHLIPQRCAVGRWPVPARVTVLEGVALRVRHDAETALPLLLPCDEPAHA